MTSILIAAIAALLPTWAGWIGLTTWGIGCGLAGWLLGHTQPRRDARALHVLSNDVADGILRVDDIKGERDKYRLAWLSARRRAHRGRLLAQLLRDTCPLEADARAAGKDDR